MNPCKKCKFKNNQSINDCLQCVHLTGRREREIIKDLSKTIRFDIEAMNDYHISESDSDFKYYYRLVKGNFIDLMKIILRKK